MTIHNLSLLDIINILGFQTYFIITYSSHVAATWKEGTFQDTRMNDNKKREIFPWGQKRQKSYQLHKQMTD